MDVDVSRLQDMHPRLAATTVADCLHKVSVGLSRHGHRHDAAMVIVLDDVERNGVLRWNTSASTSAAVLDFHRVTEDAAEAIALALVHAANGWVVRRRAQREERADWLLTDPDNQPVALEISGVDLIDIGTRRLRDKTDQVTQHPNRLAVKAACVVELSPPRCRLRTV